MVVQIEVVNGKIELVDRRRKITGGWMTNDSTFKDVKKKKKKKGEQKLHTPLGEGGLS
jgi:hypothetical protein